MEKKPRVRIETDSQGKQYVLYEVRCSVCKKCWLREGAASCLYGGPYEGYVKVDEDAS
jgi:hypothetical protein